MATTRRSAAARLDGLIAWASRHAGVVAVAALVATGAISVPFLTMSPEGFASPEPGGEVFEARDTVADRLGSEVIELFFVVEARDGELLDRESLAALHERVATLRQDSELGAVLLDQPGPDERPALSGTRTLADAVDAALAARGVPDLALADPEVVRQTASAIIDERGATALGLSAQAQRDAEGRWSAPATTMTVLVDGTQIDGRGPASGFASDVAVERVGRDIQEVLRGSEALDVWGVALDQTLTAEEQGQAAGPYIGLTVLALVVLVGLLFRSYWVLAVTGAALIALVVWLHGLSNLLGLKEDQILSTVVPIAMLAFGVDYAFHALSRYREERGNDAVRPVVAIHRGLVGVLPALALALATGAAAFLANTASGIESIVQFGLAAAGALVAAFVVLGLVTPLAISWIEHRVPATRTRRGRIGAVLGGGAAAATAMTAVLFAVFVSPPVGVIIAAAYVALFCLAPLAIAGRRPATVPPNRDGRLIPSPPSGDHPATPSSGTIPAAIARLVTTVAARRWVALSAAALLSIAATVLAVQVPVEFDAADFFAADTDFVIGLDKVDEHVGDQGGEPATILVEADLADPDVIARLEAFVAEVEALDTDLLARDGAGKVQIDPGVIALVDPGNGIGPATGRDALATRFEQARTAGLIAADGTPVITAVNAQRMVSEVDADGLRATTLEVGLVGSRSQERVAAARDLLDPYVDELSADLSERDTSAHATLTGTPIERHASLEAVSTALRTSLPLALLACFACAALALRSVRYAIVATLPIVLVVTWLYAFMYVAGFAINLVTATIGAISIGVGIDFAIHLTMRFRQELAAHEARVDALRSAAQGTGTAMVGSAATSIVGFAILAFAPMPMFAAFGLLTAVMIAMALAAALLVLPSLLLVVNRDAPPPPAPSLAPQPATTSTR